MITCEDKHPWKTAVKSIRNRSVIPQIIRETSPGSIVCFGRSLNKRSGPIQENKQGSIPAYGRAPLHCIQVSDPYLHIRYSVFFNSFEPHNHFLIAWVSHLPRAVTT